ncbi:peroxiredoxin family protein [Rubripirellula obstinata]|nr:redoxin domain-containing protein [Rubripirellula obstinata]
MRNDLLNTTCAFLFTFSAMTICLTLSGCSPQDIVDSVEKIQGSNNAMPMGKMAMPDPADIVFKDEVQSNIEVPTGLDGLVFLDTTGKRVALKEYLGSKNVVLVFTEGFGGGMLCPFCKTQTSRLVANYDKFEKLDTEILVVYPGARDHLDEFVEAAKKTEKAAVDSVPFPLVLDEDLSAVGYFNIASNLAHPSTFIIDKSGNVRLAYVGADMSADRPSVRAMLGVLSDANGS